MARKGKKNKRKEKKMSPEEEKSAMVSALTIKCDLTQEEVLEAYDAFYNEHKTGVISKEDYIKSRKVSKADA